MAITSFILSIIGTLLGIVNSIFLFKNYRLNQKNAEKQDLKSMPNFEIQFIYSRASKNQTKTRNKKKINKVEKSAKDTDWDNVNLEVVPIGGVASNLKCDVITLIQISVYDVLNSMPQNFLLKSTNFFDLATFGTDKGHFVKEGNFNYRKLICFSNELNKALTQRFGENQIFAIPYAHQYSIISFHNSLKEFCKSYYYNNHPITETAYNTAIEETSDYIDFYFSTHWDKIISNIIEKIAK